TRVRITRDDPRPNAMTAAETPRSGPQPNIRAGQGPPQPRDMIKAELDQRPGQRPDHRRAVHALHAEPRQVPAWHHHPGQSPASAFTPVVIHDDDLIAPSPHCGGSTHTFAPSATCLTPARPSR